MVVFKTLKNTIFISSKLKLKYLRCKIKYSAGRNNQGRITCRGRGGRLWKRSVSVDLTRRVFDETGRVVQILKDTARTGYVALVFYQQLGLYQYILSCDGLGIGDLVVNINPSVKLSRVFTRFPSLSKKLGNVFAISQFRIGAHVYNIEAYPGAGGSFTRAAGCSSRVLQKILLHTRKVFVAIRLRSGTIRYLNGFCLATAGQVSNVGHVKHSLNKAGVRRNMGFRPHVRGVAMNPVDHPHGGGEGKTSGGRISVTPWGKLTKGKKTLSFKKRNKALLRIYKMRRGLMVC